MYRTCIPIWALGDTILLIMTYVTVQTISSKHVFGLPLLFLLLKTILTEVTICYISDEGRIILQD